MPTLIQKIVSLFTGKNKIEALSQPQITEGQNLRAIVVSDLGNVRTNNEDMGYFIRPNDLQVRENKGFLGIVADGMGGHAAGEVASKMAVELTRKKYYDADLDIIESLKQSFLEANKAIHAEASRNSQRRGMGTTATAVVIKNRELFYAHVGDSRLYHISKEKIVQISTDHTYIQELLRKGEISQEMAAVHPERNVLVRAMGTQEKVEVDVGKYDGILDTGDRLLLCSDGLYDYLNNDEILEIVQSGELKACAYELVNCAKTRGGHDNITVIIIESLGEDLSKDSRVTTDLEDLKKGREAVTKEIDLKK